MLMDQGQKLVTNIKTGYNRCWIPTLTVDHRPDQEKPEKPEITDDDANEHLNRQSKRRRKKDHEQTSSEHDNLVLPVDQ